MAFSPTSDHAPAQPRPGLRTRARLTTACHPAKQPCPAAFSPRPQDTVTLTPASLLGLHMRAVSCAPSAAFDQHIGVRACKVAVGRGRLAHAVNSVAPTSTQLHAS